jgi:Flp pilus assembly protein TadD
VRERARAAITKALALEPESAEARGSNAGCQFWLDWDYAGAVASAQQAIAPNANHALAHFHLAHTPSNVGEQGYVPPDNVALIFAGLGDLESALD